MSKWIEEELEPGLRASYGLKKVLNSCESKWQTVDVVDLECFGRALMIDGLIQVRAPPMRTGVAAPCSSAEASLVRAAVALR